MLDLVNKHEIRPEQIDKIDCVAPYRTTKILLHPNPANKLEAKFSMNFVMAVAVTDRRVGLDQVTDDKIKDPVIQELMRKVTLHGYEGPEDRPETVTVRLKDGNEYSDGALNSRGHAEIPLTRDELIAKYEECAKRVLKDSAIERSIELIEDLEALDNIQELMNILRGP